MLYRWWRRCTQEIKQAECWVFDILLYYNKIPSDQHETELMWSYGKAQHDTVTQNTVLRVQKKWQRETRKKTRWKDADENRRKQKKNVTIGKVHDYNVRGLPNKQHDNQWQTLPLPKRGASLPPTPPTASKEHGTKRLKRMQLFCLFVFFGRDRRKQEGAQLVLKWSGWERAPSGVVVDDGSKMATFFPLAHSPHNTAGHNKTHQSEGY